MKGVKINEKKGMGITGYGGILLAVNIGNGGCRG
jgi:hypothetical protein